MKKKMYTSNKLWNNQSYSNTCDTQSQGVFRSWKLVLISHPNGNEVNGNVSLISMGAEVGVRFSLLYNTRRRQLCMQDLQ